MDEKPIFGNVAAQEFEIGDIVEWSKWSGTDNDWESHYGIIMEIKNEVKANRLVSISMVVPLNGPQVEMEFFTPSLKLVSKAKSMED